MFLFYLLITYLIPGLYVYLRINYLLIPKGKKWLFTLVWIFLLAAFPLTEIFLHEEPARFFIPLLKLGYYTMPYMLYLFLLVLLFDIFLLLDLAFRWLPAGFFKSPVFRKYGSMSGIFLPSLVVLFGIYNFSH
ncbi:MAG: hypothetical protein KFF73_09265, partial [Cyclobacteriaceae bacterium]|nr:hypothetical protein [Cyclobacteriaceae bacterium]